MSADISPHDSAISLEIQTQSKYLMSIDNVSHHRKNSPPLSGGIAPVANSDMFKSPACFQQSRSKSFQHRFTQESISRVPSTLKGLAKVHQSSGSISLGTGRPSSEYFPFERLELKVPTAPFFQESESSSSGSITTCGKYDIRQGRSPYDFSVSLNYGYGAGSVQILRFVTEHTEIVHRPRYSNWGCCLTAGSTSALEIFLRMFCERGDCILTEEYSYSGALEAARPLGLKPVGIKMDREGLVASDLDVLLTEWNVSSRGSPKPFILYTIPTGQNPTGATQSLQRRKDILEVAERHDLLIIEDDPYYFLQLDPYRPPDSASVASSSFTPQPVDNFLSQLLPSLLSLDCSGRVIRLDSTSKILAPGLRCGWFTSSSEIIERFIRHQDVSTVSPSGMSQILMYKLLDETWGHKGFLEWLMFLSFDFTRRRDVIFTACEEHLPKEVSTWDCTNAGMFHWIGVEWQKHPIASAGQLPMSQSEMAQVEDRVFAAAVDNEVICCKGSWFRTEPAVGDKFFLRTTFAATSLENITEGIRRLGQALRHEFGLGGNSL